MPLRIPSAARTASSYSARELARSFAVDAEHVCDHIEFYRIARRKEDSLERPQHLFSCIISHVVTLRYVSALPGKCARQPLCCLLAEMQRQILLGLVRYAHALRADKLEHGNECGYHLRLVLARKQQLAE